MKWIKKGLIFEPSGSLPWMVSHAALPVAHKVGEVYRIYCSGRDHKGRAQVGYFEIDLAQPSQILRISNEPIISLGPLGAFDDSGVTSSWVVNHNNKQYHYYSGWSLGVTIPFYFYIGLAVSRDEGRSLQKVSTAPILERNEIDPYLTASPCVLIEEGVWRMWYVSCTHWEIKDNQPRHYYHIKYAESQDGIRWKRQGIICIDYKSADEYAIARPCVIKDGDLYRMWYSYRGDSYRIGYAESKDGLSWERKDEEAGITVSGSGWDSEMAAYAFIFNHQDDYYMLYNGNGYGKTGIGLAVLAKDEE